MAESRVEIVQRLFAAVAARDVEAAKQLADPKVQLFAPRTGAETGQPYHLYLGHEGLDQYFEQIATVWREFEFKPREYWEHEEHVIALGSLRNQPRKGAARDDEGAWGIRFQNGAIAWARAYLKSTEALRDIPMPAIDIVARTFEAGKTWDVETMLDYISPSLEFETPVTAEATGKKTTYRGHEGLREVFDNVAEAFETLSGVPEHYWEVGDHVVAFGRVLGRTKDGNDVDTPAQWGCRLKDGKIVWWCEYTDAEAALRAVGLVAG